MAKSVSPARQSERTPGSGGCAPARLTARAAVILLAILGSSVTLLELWAGPAELVFSRNSTFGSVLLSNVSVVSTSSRIRSVMQFDHDLKKTRFVREVFTTTPAFEFGFVDAEGGVEAVPWTSGLPPTLVEIKDLGPGPNDSWSFCADGAADTGFENVTFHGCADLLGDGLEACGSQGYTGVVFPGSPTTCEAQVTTNLDSGTFYYVVGGTIGDEALAMKVVPVPFSVIAHNFAFPSLGPPAVFTDVTRNLEAYFFFGHSDEGIVGCKIIENGFELDLSFGNTSGGACEKPG